MNVQNDFILSMHNRLSFQSPAKRKAIIDKILKDLSYTIIFTKLCDFSASEDSEFEALDQDRKDKEDLLISKHIDVNKFNDLSISEQSIRLKQIELGIKPDEIKNPEKDNYGRNPLHEAVILQDKDAIEFYLKQGYKPQAKDNNGNTPYDLAVLRDDKQMMALLEKLNAAE